MSDHISGPRALADPIADITDVYAFPSPERPGRLVLVMNTLPFAKLSNPLSDGLLYRFRVRPLTGNALLGTLASDEVSDQLKEEYNAATPETSARFVAEIEHNLGLYDGFDGVCGNQLLAGTVPQRRYLALATLLADDRLWVNSA